MQMDMFEKKLHPKQRELIVRAAEALANLGCKYYIKTVDGEVMSMGMKAATSDIAKGSIAAPKKFKRGDRRAYVKPFIDAKLVRAGDIVSIPPNDDFPLKEVANAAASYCHDKFGNGQYQVETNKTNNMVEVMYNGGIKV